MRKLFVVFVLLVIIGFLWPQEKVEYNLPKSPAPDTTREVYTFDWDNMRFIYKDQIKPDEGYKGKIPQPFYEPVRVINSGENNSNLETPIIIRYKNDYYRIEDELEQLNIEDF